MKKVSRIICLLLSAFLCLGCMLSLASCNKASKNEESSESTNDITLSTGDENSEQEKYRPGDVDMGGYDYKILVETNSKGQSNYVYQGEGAPREVCDYALYMRQNLMEERHGVITGIINEGSSASSKLQTAILANQKDYCQAAALDTKQWPILASKGHLYDLNTLDELNLEASYWDQRIQKEFNVNGHLFVLEGEYSYIEDLSTYVIIYNDTAYRDLGYYETYGTPYQLSADGKWTFEMMMTMIKGIAHEVDGNQLMDENDFWGFVSEGVAPYVAFLGSGQKYTINDGGRFEFAGKDDSVWDRNYNILEDVMRITINEDVFLPGIDQSSEGDVWAIASEVFSSNRALFRLTALNATLRLLNMEDDYGIMPIPAYTENQDGYYCMTLGQPFCIPTCVSDPHKSAQTIDMISYYSLYMGGDSLNYAFYDLLAFARLCRSSDDVNMLKLIFANKTYDIDYTAGFSNVLNVTGDLSSKKDISSLYSSIASMRESADTVIQTFLVNVEANLKATD